MERYVNDYFEINGKQMIKMAKKAETIQNLYKTIQEK